jgi:Neuraminidase (sialidase)
MVYVYYNDRQMKATNTEIFETTSFGNIILIDSSGMKYVTKGAFITRYWGFLEGLFRMKGKVVSFEFEYKDAGTPITLDELKAMIMERYPKSRWFRSAWSNVAEFQEEMDKCDTFKQVALLFEKPPSNNLYTLITKGY